MSFRGFFLFCCFFTTLFSTLIGCDRLENEPIRIGFVGGLTGLKLGARTRPELKRVLLQQDSFGDVQRDLFLTIVQRGEFVVVRQFPGENN